MMIQTYYTECVDDYARVFDSEKVIVGLIQVPDKMNGQFLFYNNTENISETTHQQMSYIHEELGKELLCLPSSSMFLLVRCKSCL